MPFKVAVTGISGQVGRAIAASAPGSWDVTGADSSTVDVRDWIQVRDWISSYRPNLVIHAAAKTDVDGCETGIDDAFTTNALGTRHVAGAAERVGARLVYISTNFVFDGGSDRPYHEFDCPDPINVYGASKLAGEREAQQFHHECYVVRSAMVYDESGRNFVNTMRRLMAERDRLTIVDDQYGNPTYAPDLADGIIELVQTCPAGTYHLTNGGSTSWFGWASEIQHIAQYECELVPIAAAEYERPASPPMNGRLTSLAWPEGIARMPDWRDALRRCMS